MNNRWLVWQIRRGQASVEDADVLVWGWSAYVSAEQREGDEDADQLDLLRVLQGQEQNRANVFSCLLSADQK